MAEGAPTTFAEVWVQIPFVTRHLGLLAIVLYGLFLIQPYWAIKFWLLPGALARGQVWRAFTAPFAYAGDRFSGLLAVFNFCTSLNSLELRGFQRRSDLVVYIAFLATIFNIAGPYIGQYAYLVGMASAMTYTSCQEAPYAMQQLIFIQVKAGYVPWANVLLGFILAGVQGMFVPLLGIASGHAFLFLNELLPQAGGPRLLGTPQWLSNAIDHNPEAAAKRKTYGRGHRLA